MLNDFVMHAVQNSALVLFDSQSMRTFLHLDDAVRAYCMVLEKVDNMIGNVFNVGSSDLNLSKMDLAKAIHEHVEFSIVDSTLRGLDVRDFIIDFDRINSLGYKATKSLHEGIQELVKLFQFYKPNPSYRII